MNEFLHSKFGNCSINNNGHYRITSRKEGNHGKLLHRLIWEDFYGCEVPDGFVIHHKNGLKTDNCILNLQLMRDESHKRFHTTGKDNSNEKNPMYGKTHKDESKLKMSLKKSSTGIFRVHKRNEPQVSKGYAWFYEFRNGECRKTFSSVSLKKLKDKIIGKGLEWIVLDETKAKLICDMENINYEEIL